MSLTEVNKREKDFHNKLQSNEEERFENGFYKALDNINDDFFDFLSNNSKDAEILDYGCGIGTFVEKVIKFSPKNISGIDISEISINKAKKRAIDLNFKVNYNVDNCEKTNFSDKKFDIIYGSGILHHLELEKSLNEIYRILKNNGKILFVEPLGTNPLINYYRQLTPKARSEDEHPLIKKDFDFMKKKFNNISIKYYGFLTLIFFPFYSTPSKSKTFKILAKADQFLFKFSFFKQLAWSVLIKAEKS